METSGLSAYAGSGLPALFMALALVGIAIGVLLVAVAVLSPYWPRARVVLTPLNMAIVVVQLLDGATTWVGVYDPFGFRLPPFQEQVFLSAWVIDTFGGAAFFVLKGVIALGVVAALDYAFRAASSLKERTATFAVQMAVFVAGMVPVVNNVNNFLAVA